MSTRTPSPSDALRRTRSMRAQACPRYARSSAGSSRSSACHAGVHDRARLQHVAAVGHRQRERGHLVDEQDRHALIAQLGQHVEQLVDQCGCQAQATARRAAAPSAWRSARGRWRASAARRRTRGPRDCACAARSTESARASLPLRAGSKSRARIRAQTDVVDHRQLGKHLPSFGHQHQSLAGDAMRREGGDLAARRTESCRPPGVAAPTASA